MQYKFRGKSVETGEWIYGSLVDGLCPVIVPEFKDENKEIPIFYEVIPKTVGVWTGRKDKNKVEIYEDDITRQKSPDENVLIEKDGSWFVGSALSETEWEVIGNRFDNPELLTQ